MFSPKKPYSSISVLLEQLTNETWEVNDLSGIPDLVEAIHLQSTGPAEAIRVICKKIKYGRTHQQLRALVILDGLMQNAGDTFQWTCVDDNLLTRLRLCATSPSTDVSVKETCYSIFQNWAWLYTDKPGLDAIAELYSDIPRQKDYSAPPPPHQRFGKDTKRSRSFFEKIKSTQREPIPVREAKNTIAEAWIAATDLQNALQTINTESERVTENQEAMIHLRKCQQYRKRVANLILRITSEVGPESPTLPTSPSTSKSSSSEESIGALIRVNEELVKALQKFKELDHAHDLDSDSDDGLKGAQLKEFK